MSDFRFAIMGAGNIAHKFADAARRLEGCTLCAVASSSLERAESFAQQEGIPAFYGSYEEMLKIEKPDCVYIATVTSRHFALAELCARYRVNVLCEKAMFNDYNEATRFDELAKEAGIFWMEAMWSRFLPANIRAREAIREGFIGDVCYCDVEIGFKAPEGSDNRYFSPKLGGGAARDITVYAYEISHWLLDSEEEASYVHTTFADTGVDAADAVLVKLKNGIPVTIKTSFVSSYSNELTVQGTDGVLVIPNPHYASGFCTYRTKGEPASGSFRDEVTQNGFVYEAEEVVRCIRAGLTESPVVPHKDTIAFAKLTSRILER